MKTKHRNAAKSKRRYQADPMAIFKLINRIEPYTDQDVVQLALPARMAFQAIKTGTGTTDDFDELAVSVNSTMVRSESIDELCVQTCIIAQEALLRCKERYPLARLWRLPLGERNGGEVPAGGDVGWMLWGMEKRTF